jgi:type IV secretory pathway TrbD component
MSAFALWMDYDVGKLTTSHTILFVSILFIGGCLFGVAMWAVGEFRFRRLLAKANSAGT